MRFGDMIHLIQMVKRFLINVTEARRFMKHLNATQQWLEKYQNTLHKKCISVKSTTYHTQQIPSNIKQDIKAHWGEVHKQLEAAGCRLHVKYPSVSLVGTGLHVRVTVIQPWTTPLKYSYISLWQLRDL